TLPSPTDLAAVVSRTANELLRDLDVGDGLRLLGVSVHQLELPTAGNEQQQLSFDDEPAPRSTAARGDLERAAARVRPRSAEAAAAAHDTAVAMPTIDALAAAVDVVWVCTWTAAHAAAVHAAVAAGRPVFCEKPLAPSLAECETVAADLRRVPHQVGLVLRY